MSGAADGRRSVAWVAGASGTWGRAVALELLRRGWDVTGLGRRELPELAAWAARHELRWYDHPFDLAATEPTLPRGTPDALFVCTAATDGDALALVMANYLAPAALIGAVAERMAAARGGRIGVLLGQNARLGLHGLGEFSAGQAALWTWCESLQAELAGSGGDVTVTRIIPPRTASATQRFVAERSGRSAVLRTPDPKPLVDAVLAGRRRAGRRPVLAALSTAFR